MKPAVFLVGVLALSACDLQTFNTISKTIRIACGIADVVLSETEFAKAQLAFGEGSVGAGVCELFLPDGASSDTPLSLPATQTEVLPTARDGTELGTLTGRLEAPAS